MTVREAVAEVLGELGPTHYKKVAEEVVARGLALGGVAEPAQSVASVFSVDAKQGGAARFVRVGPGVYGLRAGVGGREPAPVDDATGADGSSSSGPVVVDPSANRPRVRIPWFPTYRQLRHLLRIWPGWTRSQVTGLKGTLEGLRGTPQNPVDWTEPQHWIPERLSGTHRDLAEAIWTNSGQKVNPRYATGHWLLANRYELLADGLDGTLALTERGRRFLEHELGDEEAALDGSEGVLHILNLVGEHGPVRQGGLVDGWREFLADHSGFRKPSVIRDTLRRRLNNLLDRRLVSRDGVKYQQTDLGVDYLTRHGGLPVPDPIQELRKRAAEHDATVRERLRGHLHSMDPYAFERLVGSLLEAMDYQNVDVVGASGDGGVVVKAEIELGITSVREVVQVKRHKRAIQRKDVDALRGSLHRFDAVRGSIVTTSSFAKGAQKSAFTPAQAPITLIDGDKLIDLLIEHGMGVRKREVPVLALALDTLDDLVRAEDG